MSTLHAVHGWWLAGVATEATPAPTPTTVEVPAEDQTSPGLLGFLVTFAVALAVIVLAVAMVRAMRRVDHRARVEAEQAELAAGDGTSEDPADDDGEVPEDGATPAPGPHDGSEGEAPGPGTDDPTGGTPR